MIETRRGTVSDIPKIMPIMAAAFDPLFGEAWSEAQCCGAMSIPGTSLLLVEKNSQIIGFALIRTIVDASELFLIAVHPFYQGQSIGAALFDAVRNHAFEQGSKSILVEVREDNRAILFYDRLGFERIGKRFDYYKRKDNGPNGAITLILTM
jgi:[ribosomal protein S18]-alanine N-acetyltransferase